MKCIKLINNEIVRCENDYAEMLVRKKTAIYVNKEKWKITGRKYINKQLNKENLKWD